LGQKSRSKRALLGPATVKTAASRKIFDFRQTKFWAERGLVHTVNEETGAFSTCSVREWLLRAQALSAQASREKFADEREQLITLVENMIKVAKQAKAQGDPHTAAGRDEVRRRAPLRVMMPEVTYSYRQGEVRTGPAAKLILPGDPGYR
jgi:hypothetical protein